MDMYDSFRRKIEYVRVSVTDRCNLRCRYCMPAHGVRKMRHADVLSYEEILRVIRALARLGVRKVRLTGGEPLVRTGIVDFVRQVKAVPGVEHVALTTNGALLGGMAAGLKAAGLDSVNVSLDTLDAATFSYLARQPLLPQVLAGLEQLASVGLTDVKINCVPIAGVNEADILQLAELARQRPIKIRFIELMPIGCAREAGLRGMPMDEVRRRLAAAFGPLTREAAAAPSLRGPAEYVRPAGFRGEIGFIDAMGHKFCSTCNRVRLTAEGFLKLCLHAGTGLDVRALLRGGADDAALGEALSGAIYEKPAEHFFLEQGGAQDKRYMYQVGG